MEKLIILDYSTSSVDIYDIEEDVVIDDTTIKKLGHNSDECAWMVGNNIRMDFNQKVIRNENSRTK